MQDALNLRVHHQVHCDKQRCRARWAGHELISWPQSPPSPYASFMPHAPPTASVSLLPRQSTVRKARVFKNDRSGHDGRGAWDPLCPSFADRPCPFRLLFTPPSSWAPVHHRARWASQKTGWSASQFALGCGWHAVSETTAFQQLGAKSVRQSFVTDKGQQGPPR